MKKFFLILVMTAVLLGLFAKDELVWCTRLLLERATVHEIQPGEYFSKLSKQYYGTAAYWRELALINRAPDSDLVFPGEKVIIPSLEAVQKLHLSRSLSAVNRIVDEQKMALAPAEQPTQLSQNQPTAPLPAAPAQTSSAEELNEMAVAELQNSSSFSLTMAILIALGVLLLAGAVLLTLKWIRGKQEPEKSPAPAHERSIPEPHSQRKQVLVN